MRPVIATVLSARRWEANLVLTARSRGMARVLARCVTARDVDRVVNDVDALVIGSDTPWLTEPMLTRWAGRTVLIGVAEDGDPIARRLLAPAADVFPASTPAERLLATLAGFPRRLDSLRRGPVMTVTGPRGAPGRSEVALAVGWHLSSRGSTLLVELDTSAPSLGLRLGLTPFPDALCGDPLVHPPLYRRIGDLQVLTAPARVGPMSESIITRIVESARLDFDHIVLDPGPLDPADLPVDSDRVVVVCEPTAVGLTRCARLLAGWRSGVPDLVINRAPGDVALREIRAALGLEPVAVIPLTDRIPPGSAPSRVFTDAVAKLTDDRPPEQGTAAAI